MIFIEAMSRHAPIFFMAALLVPGCARGTDPSDHADATTDTTVDTAGDGPCLPGAYWHCVDGNVHAFDSCDNEEGLLWECGLHGECVDVTPTRAICQCDPGWLGGTCDSCGYHVDVDASASGDGDSWETAYSTIQEGIDAAHDALRLPGAPETCQVWVAEGTYHIFSSAATDTVLMRAGVQIYGGFSGGEVDLTERDVLAHVTRIHGADVPDGTNRVHHVITGANASLIDGFVIEGGSAQGAATDGSGGGLVCLGTSPTVQNCIFNANFASASGGAFAALSGAGPTITGTLFTNNSAVTDGGALFVDAGEVTVTGSIFAANSASDDGGGIAAYAGATLTLQNCVLAGNLATNSGGGLFTHQSTASVMSCTFTANSASSGGAIWVEEGSGSVTNSILWADTGGEIGRSSTAVGTVRHCNVQGGMAGTGNIDEDPLFAGVADFHLTAGSPCIDAGDAVGAPELDIEGNPRVDDPATADTGSGDPSWVDMGAYEYQP